MTQTVLTSGSPSSGMITCVIVILWVCPGSRQPSKITPPNIVSVTTAYIGVSRLGFVTFIQYVTSSPTAAHVLSASFVISIAGW